MKVNALASTYRQLLGFTRTVLHGRQVLRRAHPFQAREAKSRYIPVTVSV